MSVEPDVTEMFKRLAGEYGRVDIVVANAGLQRDAPLRDMTLAQWNEVLASNLTGQFLCLREAVRRFAAQGDAPASRARGKIDRGAIAALFQQRQRGMRRAHHRHHVDRQARGPTGLVVAYAEARRVVDRSSVVVTAQG